MSSRSDEDFSCPICQDIYKDPVVLWCSHSFCKSCIQTWWKGNQRLCPCCKRMSPESEPPRNLALKNLCEAYLQERGRRGAEEEGLCRVHGEKLRLFCLDHMEAACLVCRDSKRHTEHTFRPMDEAAQEHREKLHRRLKPLQDKLKLFQQVRGECGEMAEHVRVQARHTEGQMKERFEKLHQLLREEEEARVKALREEEEQRSQMVKEKMEDLDREIQTLSHTVRAAEEVLRSEDASFLLRYEAAVQRVQQQQQQQQQQQRPLQDDPQVPAGALIDVAKHLGNLTFHIWCKLKELVSFSPLILDPNTADPDLLVSEDLTSVSSGERRLLPKTPERTRFSCSVLGSVGFNSGTHSWGVEVGDNEDWEVGVLGERLQRKERLQDGLWRILFSHRKLVAFSTSGEEEDLPLRTKLRGIRVHLDFDEGELSFYNLHTNTHIHTFTHPFTHTLFPYVYTESRVPLRISPVRVCVTVEQQVGE